MITFVLVVLTRTVINEFVKYVSHNLHDYLWTARQDFLTTCLGMKGSCENLTGHLSVSLSLL